MPFTFSHPAVAIPLVRCGLPLSALIVGSMAPDFPYFLHLSTHYQYGHTWPGLFWFCLPAGLVVLWLFHALLKLPLLALLPSSHQARLMATCDFRFGPARQFALIVLALLLGAVTHLVWDSFTHAGGWSVAHFAILRAPVIDSAHGTVFVFKILQHGSTVLGAAWLLIWYRRWFERTEAPLSALPLEISPLLKTRFFAFLLGFPVLLAFVYSFAATAAVFEIQAFVRRFVVASVGITLVELIIYSMIWQWKARRQRCP